MSKVVLALALALACIRLTAAADQPTDENVLKARPHHIAVGTVAIGSTGVAEGTLENIGNSALLISTVEVFGDSQGDIMYDVECFNSLLAAGDVCPFSIFLTPTLAGRIDLTYCLTGYDPNNPDVAERECGAITGRSVP